MISRSGNLMRPKTFEMQRSEIPLSQLEQISSVIHSYSTGLIKITTHYNQERALLIGSGTFISVQGTYGILTAHHVTQQLEIDSTLGMILIAGGQVHRPPPIDFQFLTIVNIARGTVDSIGPDLSFIVLPNLRVAEIKPYKHFYDLSVDRDKMLNKPPDPHDGAWLLCGIIDERTKEEAFEKGSDKILSFEGLCGAVGVNKRYVSGDFDYIEAEIDYEKGVNVPRSFGGVSGGGLWQVFVRKSVDESIELTNPLLSGVAFYQSKVEGSKRFIKCHGVTSIYKNVYDNLIKMGH